MTMMMMVNAIPKRSDNCLPIVAGNGTNPVHTHMCCGSVDFVPLTASAVSDPNGTTDEQ